MREKSRGNKNSSENKRAITAWDYDDTDMIEVEEATSIQSKGERDTNESNSLGRSLKRTVYTVNINREQVGIATENSQKKNSGDADMIDVDNDTTILSKEECKMKDRYAGERSLQRAVSTVKINREQVGIATESSQKENSGDADMIHVNEDTIIQPKGER